MNDHRLSSCRVAPPSAQCGLRATEAERNEEAGLSLTPPATAVRPDFETLRALAERDPSAFERRRRELLEAYIATTRTENQQRLHALQWRLDQERRNRPPLGVCVTFTRMMWESLYGDGGLMKALADPHGCVSNERNTVRTVDFGASSSVR